MTRAEELRRLKLANPFVPFRLHLTDGRVFDVPTGWWVLVGREWAVVGLPNPGRNDGIPDGHVMVWYAHLARVEVLDADPAVVVS
jgi:hypothetical protein